MHRRSACGIGTTFRAWPDTCTRKRCSSKQMVCDWLEPVLFLSLLLFNFLFYLSSSCFCFLFSCLILRWSGARRLSCWWSVCLDSPQPTLELRRDLVWSISFFFLCSHS
jgi:hypothetical protein